MKKLIVFVCNGNIHRSVIAEEYLNKILKKKQLNSKFVAISYGLQGTQGTAKPLHKKLIEYPKEWKASLPTLKKFKIDISNHSYQKITLAIAKKSAVIIAMDKKVFSTARNALVKQFPKARNKIHIFSELTKNHKVIIDPAGNGSFRVHQMTIKNTCLTIHDELETILEWAKL